MQATNFARLSLGIILLIAAALIVKKICFASTPPIRDHAGQLLSGSVAQLEKVPLGGMDQWILIRGANQSLPVLLWLHGGPGSAQMPVAHAFNAGLEQEFVVVHWDQRGAGKSNPAGFDESSMTIDQFVADAHELTQYLKQRFHQDKIYLLGHSWGTRLGARLAAAYPQDYYAYVGVSQVVDHTAANQLAYDWLSARLAQPGQEKELQALQTLGSPPYFEHETYVRFIQMVEKQGGGMDVGFARLAWAALHAPEYTLPDLAAWMQGSTRGSGRMWPETIATTMLEDAPAIDIPVYFFCGQNDTNTPAALVQQYSAALKAPRGKQVILFEKSAHTPFFAEPQKFHQALLRVKQETLPPGD